LLIIYSCTQGDDWDDWDDDEEEVDVGETINQIGRFLHSMLAAFPCVTGGACSFSGSPCFLFAIVPTVCWFANL
jgi:hypothetical protein